MTNTKYNPEEPIAAVATALVPAALGIIRVSGKNSIKLLSGCFSRPEALLKAEGNTIVYGWITDKTDSSSGKVQKIDEVLVSVFRAPKSFTGEEMCEISCHGGIAVINSILHLLLKNGFRPAEKGEFTFRAFINGKADLTKAEAVKEIIDSKTDSSRSHAAGRLNGHLFSEIENIKKEIVDTLAAIEVDIEYPEDEETIADSFNPEKLKNARNTLQQLANSWKTEKIYQEGAKIVLAGKTNAGKSSLFNALLKEDRSIVSDIEGTTRDWIESQVNFNGIPARIFDTAGLRLTDDVIEAKGVELTKNLADESDLLLYLVDSSVGLSDDDKDFLQNRLKTRGLIVFNKNDKATAQTCNPEELKKLNQNIEGICSVSAKNGNGIGELCASVSSILLSDKTARSETAGLGSQRQKNLVEEALERVNHALEITEDETYGLDAVVQDLEDALDNLGEITGEVTSDDILSSIFSNFCVGK